MTRLVVLQSNYLPWRGYFDLIATADHLIVYDTAQFTKNDWRNRNRIKTASGPKWLTVPVVTAGRFGQPIDAVEIAGQDWAESHLSLIRQSYADAPYLDVMLETITPSLTVGHTHLSALNRDLIERLCAQLDIHTPITDAREHPHTGDATQKLVDLCRSVGATTYVSGPAAKSYLDEGALAEIGVAVEWYNYAGYPDYPQHHGAFDPQVSIIDLLAETGGAARSYMHCGNSRSA